MEFLDPVDAAGLSIMARHPAPPQVAVARHPHFSWMGWPQRPPESPDPDVPGTVVSGHPDKARPFGRPAIAFDPHPIRGGLARYPDRARAARPCGSLWNMEQEKDSDKSEKSHDQNEFFHLNPPFFLGADSLMREEPVTV